MIISSFTHWTLVDRCLLTISGQPHALFLISMSTTSRAMLIGIDRKEEEFLRVTPNR